MESENKRFESIISFPNFLLQVNKALTQLNIDDDSSLDDKNFLENLKKTGMMKNPRNISFL